MSEKPDFNQEIQHSPELDSAPVLRYPVQAAISQPFGNDATGQHTFYELFENKHPGVDFNLPEGTPVNASFDGIIVRQENHRGMGNTVGIRNGSIVALYAHLSTIDTTIGSVVGAEHLIGMSGNTGQATFQPHLHFELRDLSQTTLPAMVFEPNFNQSIDRWQSHFTYTVHNTTTPKNLLNLSLLFFGDSDYVDLLRAANPSLSTNPEQILPQHTPVTIPNFPAAK